MSKAIEALEIAIRIVFSFNQFLHYALLVNLMSGKITLKGKITSQLVRKFIEIFYSYDD